MQQMAEIQAKKRKSRKEKSEDLGELVLFFLLDINQFWYSGKLMSTSYNEDAQNLILSTTSRETDFYLSGTAR